MSLSLRALALTTAAVVAAGALAGGSAYGGSREPASRSGNLRLIRMPAAKTDSTTATFVWAGMQGASTCRLDNSRPARCHGQLTYRGLHRAAHHFSVDVRGRSATWRWLVTTPTAAPAIPHTAGPSVTQVATALASLLPMAGASSSLAVAPSVSRPDARGPSLATLGAPFGVGDSAGNVRINSANGLAAVRWVARRTGTISRLWVKTRTDTHGGAPDSSYYGGTTGRWSVVTYPALPNGLPDQSHPVADESFVPVQRMTSDSSAQGNPTGEAIGLNLNMPVTAGQLFVTTVRNIDPNPSINYASLNFLYSAGGLQGAQARDELNPQASDGLYGLDPRELVGGAYNGTWYMPGNNNGPFAKFLPVYVQQYSDGATEGQPYYTGHDIPAGSQVVETFHSASPRVIAGVGAYLTNDVSLQATLSVDGTAVASVPLTGAPDQFVHALLPHTVAVGAGASVQLSTTVPSNGALKAYYADSVFERLMGLGAAYKWSYQQDPTRTVALYAIDGG